MELGYGEIEDLLARLHDIAADKRVTLRGRIKNFQRLGWPEGINTGRGKPAIYGFEQTLRLTLSFELLQLGLTPERITDILRSNWHVVVKAAQVASDTEGTMICFDPHALHFLSPPEVEDGKLWDPDKAFQTFKFGSPTYFKNWFDRPGGAGARRMSMIDLSALLHEIRAQTNLSPEQWAAGLEEWFEGYRRNQTGEWSPNHLN